MSEELKRKLLNHAVNPPEKMWARIVNALSEEVDAKFPQKMYEAEITPPASVWNKISSVLEVDSREEYAEKLYQLEVAPPGEAWRKISAAIQEERAIPQIPSRRKITPFVRYAIAASVIGAMAFGGFKLLNHKSNDLGVATKTVLPQNTPPNLVQPDSSDNSMIEPAPAPSNNLPKERTASVKTSIGSRRRLPAQAVYMTQMVNPSTALINSPGHFQQASLRGEIPGNCPVISDADRYLMFMNPDGYLIRISKKLAETLGCLYTNGNSAEYNQCQEQIKKWRDKIAQSPASSSPDNFMDLLDIIKSVQDKEL